MVNRNLGKVDRVQTYMGDRSLNSFNFAKPDEITNAYQYDLIYFLDPQFESMVLPNQIPIDIYFYISMHEIYIRVGKTGSLGLWSKVIGYCRTVRMLSVISLVIMNKW